MARSSRIKRGDTVRIISGKSKGEEGKVLSILRDRNRVIVENVNVIKKTQRPTQQNPRGGFQEVEASIHLSNVMVLDPKSGQPTRIGIEYLEDGRKIRIARKSGARLDE